jgi:CheY-like chemotaxis protein
LISHEPNHEVSAETADTSTALVLIRQHRPHLLLADLSRKRSSGLALIKQIAALPAVPAVLVSTYDEVFFAEGCDPDPPAVSSTAGMQAKYMTVTVAQYAMRKFRSTGFFGAPLRGRPTVRPRGSSIGTLTRPKETLIDRASAGTSYASIKASSISW